jgi:hypothetical protein
VSRVRVFARIPPAITAAAETSPAGASVAVVSAESSDVPAGLLRVGGTVPPCDE